MYDTQPKSLYMIVSRLHRRLLLLFLSRCDRAYALCGHESAAQHAVLSLCSSERWIETAYASYPCWTTFVDVGANKGYTAALFFGLWYRAGGLRGTRHWWREHVQAGIWPARVRKGFCGACLDCLGDAPLTCYNQVTGIIVNCCPLTCLPRGPGGPSSNFRRYHGRRGAQ